MITVNTRAHTHVDTSTAGGMVVFPHKGRAELPPFLFSNLCVTLFNSFTGGSHCDDDGSPFFVSTLLGDA